MHTSRIIVIGNDIDPRESNVRYIVRGNDIDPDESNVRYIESKLLLLMQYK